MLRGLGTLILFGALCVPALAQDTPPPAAPIELIDDVSMGAADAKVTIDEYASMTCIHCAAFANDVFPAFKEKYIDTGLVRYTLKPFPLDAVAAGAFMMTRCDADSEFYPRIEHLFKVQESWAFTQTPGPDLLAAMSTFGFDEAKYRACLDNDSVLGWIIATQDYATTQIGLKSTPTFVVNGESHVGNMTLDQLSAVIDPLLQ